MRITAKHFETLNDFIPYFNSYYGVNGLYSHGRNYDSADIIKAMVVMFATRPDHGFDGDTVDREIIRDIMTDHPFMIEHFKNKGNK